MAAPNAINVKTPASGALIALRGETYVETLSHLGVRVFVYLDTCLHNINAINFMKNTAEERPQTPPAPRTPEQEKSHRMAIAVAFGALALYIGFAQASLVGMCIVFAVTYGLARLLSVKLW